MKLFSICLKLTLIIILGAKLSSVQAQTCTPANVISIFGSTGPLFPNSLQTLSANGQLNDDQDWVWYIDDCGTTMVATGQFFNISPSVTTTYYVRGEGTCSGQTGNCASIQILVIDNELPIAMCQNITISLDNTLPLIISPSDIDAGSNDNSGSLASRTVSPNSFDCMNEGQNVVALTVTDPSGNTATCLSMVTVEVPDMDEDGICDLEDSCIDLPGQIGDSCDDNNEETLGDVITEDCICIGPIPIPTLSQWSILLLSILLLIIGVTMVKQVRPSLE